MCIKAFVLPNPILDIGPLAWSEKSIEATKQLLLIDILYDIDVATFLGPVITLCSCVFV